MIRTIASLIFCLLIAQPAYSKEGEIEDKLIPSTPDQIATLANDPDSLVGGLISPLSGQLTLRQIDMVVKGAQNITLSRLYIPPWIPETFQHHNQTPEEWQKFHLCAHLKDNYQGWKFLPHYKLQYTPRPWNAEVRLTDPNGTTLDFYIKPKGETELVLPPYAISNAIGDTPSGKHDPRNTQIFQTGNQITVYAPDGTQRLYDRKGWMKGRTSQLYLLQKETLPNGKILKYTYNRKMEPIAIQSMDPKERHTYATITIENTIENTQFTASSGQTTQYNYEKRPITFKAKEKGSKLEGNLLLPPILKTISSPNYRHETIDYQNQHLLTTYTGKDHTFTCQYASIGETPHYKIQKLTLPTGPKDTPQPLYEITYQPPIAGEKEGTTTIKNNDRTTTIYHYSKNLLPTKIQYYQDNTLKKEKNITWTDNNRLKTIEIKNQHNPHYRKTYEHDKYGVRHEVAQILVVENNNHKFCFVTLPGGASEVI